MIVTVSVVFAAKSPVTWVSINLHSWNRTITPYINRSMACSLGARSHVIIKPAIESKSIAAVRLYSVNGYKGKEMQRVNVQIRYESVLGIFSWKRN